MKTEKKTYRSMTPEEQKEYRRQRYQTSNFEITLRLKDLTPEQQAAIINALSSIVKVEA